MHKVDGQVKLVTRQYALNTRLVPPFAQLLHLELLTLSQIAERDCHGTIRILILPSKKLLLTGKLLATFFSAHACVVQKTSRTQSAPSSVAKDHTGALT